MSIVRIHAAAPGMELTVTTVSLFVTDLFNAGLITEGQRGEIIHYIQTETLKAFQDKKKKLGGSDAE